MCELIWCSAKSRILSSCERTPCYCVSSTETFQVIHWIWLNKKNRSKNMVYTHKIWSVLKLKPRMYVLLLYLLFIEELYIDCSKWQAVEHNMTGCWTQNTKNKQKQNNVPVMPECSCNAINHFLLFHKYTALSTILVTC